MRFGIFEGGFCLRSRDRKDVRRNILGYEASEPTKDFYLRLNICELQRQVAGVSS